MNLVLDTARLLAGKLFAVLLIATVLVFGTFFWNWSRNQKDLQEEVAALRIEAATAQADWQTNRFRFLNAEMLQQRLEAARPNPILHPSDYLTWRSEIQAAEAAVSASRNARDRAKALHESTVARLQNLESRIDTTLADILASAGGMGRTVGIATLAFLLGPLLWKALWYYGFASFARKSPPIHVVPDDTSGSCRVLDSGKVLNVTVQPETPLLTRMEWLQQYSPALGKKTRFLLDWRFPFVSYASGLREMTEVSVKSGHAADTAVLTSADDPNAYLFAIELRQHPGIVLKPGVVVAVQGAIRVESRWKLGSLHAWISGRLRHILFRGSGTLFVTGHGGVELKSVTAPVVVEESLVLGYDGRTGFSTERTETFWPYFRNRTSLFDYRFDGGQSFFRQVAAPVGRRGRGNPISRAIEGVLNAIGKVLGL